MRSAKHAMTRRPGRSLVAGAILAALLSSLSLTIVTQLWHVPLDVPFQYAHVPGDDEQDATLDMMLIKDVHETGWFDTNPALNAPFEQHWAEWPMGGDLLAYTVKKGLVDATGNVPLTLNLFWRRHSWVPSSSRSRRTTSATAWPTRISRSTWACPSSCSCA